MEVIHITPINDTVPHVEDGTTCHCQPVAEHAPMLGIVMVTHNAIDCRELREVEGFHPRKN